MKKLLLLLLGLLSWMQCLSQTDFNLSPEEEKEAWKLLIQKFFPEGLSDFRHPAKFYDPIAYYIVNPQERDSLLLQNIIDQVNPLIPQQVFYAKNREDANFIIELAALPENDSIPHINLNNFVIGNQNGYYNNEIVSLYYNLELPENRRLEIIRNTALVGLIYRRSGYQHLINLQQKSLFLKKSLQLFEETVNFQLNSLDRFILKKLYAKDLDDQVQNFIIKEYGYWTWLNFVFNEDLLQILKIIAFLFLVIGIVLLLHRFIKSIRSKYQIINYILQGIILSSIIVALISLYSYLRIEPHNQIIHTGSIEKIDWAFFWIQMGGISILSGFFSLFLFILDYYILSKFGNIFYRALIRILNFAAIILILTAILIVTKNSVFLSLALQIGLYTALFFICILRSIFLYFIEKNENLILEKDLQLSNLAALKAEAEVASLHARINPHFLYNALNSIAGLAHIDADKTEKMALSLSDLFRHNLNRKNEAFSTIKEEIDATIAYMDIEQIRFGDQLLFNIEIDESLYHYFIPRNIIQPLLENAIKHGISKLNVSGKIMLKISQNEDLIEIAVFDNGPDFKDGSISGYGLQSVFDILKFTYSEKASLNWENTPEKRVWITIDKTALKKEQYEL
ncbi:sensor histidine kinase [Zunongwangia pacifica]|uniref:Histidine kinase n=1 Tax=Zunongwangia pacifica TaxID=2911062 RepID=A0A9X2CQA5_9FLAO|nr:histidine kinase [Zunongwangia pacifica]MCL6219438.1 histidine kinase [Zunongwangia pacifica]